MLNEIITEFKNHSFNWENKPTVSKLKDIELSVPVKPNGDFDLIKQKEIALKYRKTESIKKLISIELNKLTDTNIKYE